jgi:hypothetical protein
LSLSQVVGITRRTNVASSNPCNDLLNPNMDNTASAEPKRISRSFSLS